MSKQLSLLYVPGRPYKCSKTPGVAENLRASRGMHMPRKPAEDGPKDAGISIRTTHKLRDKLIASAKENGRSLAQEVERKLEQAIVGGDGNITTTPAEVATDDFYSNIKSDKNIYNITLAISECCVKALQVAKDRNFDEEQTRKTLQTAVRYVSYIYFWTGDEFLAPLGERISSGVEMARDLSPEAVGFRVAKSVIVFASAFSDGSVPDDTLSGRINNRWSGDGSLVRQVYNQSDAATEIEQQIRSGRPLEEIMRERGLRWEEPEKLAKYKPVE